MRCDHDPKRDGSSAIVSIRALAWSAMKRKMKMQKLKLVSIRASVWDAILAKAKEKNHEEVSIRASVWDAIVNVALTNLNLGFGHQFRVYFACQSPL